MRKQRLCTEERFLADVSSHTMTVLHDDGVFRSLRFAKPGTGNMHFVLTTWHGHLAITGDMGDAIFSRLEDMFEFFRTEPYTRRDGVTENLPINPGYWAEKCKAVSRFGGMDEFDMDCFRDAVKYHFDTYFEDEEDPEKKAECWEEIESQVLSLDPETSENAYRTAMDFEHEGFTFQDFCEHSLTSYTFHFIWILYAITWGIRQYDAAKVATETIQA